MNAKEYFKSLLDKNIPKTSVINALYKKPIKDKGLEALRFDYITPNYYQQADLLTLPNE